jgi:hypothetical protein
MTRVRLVSGFSYGLRLLGTTVLVAAVGFAFVGAGLFYVLSGGFDPTNPAAVLLSQRAAIGGAISLAGVLVTLAGVLTISHKLIADSVATGVDLATADVAPETATPAMETDAPATETDDTAPAEPSTEPPSRPTEPTEPREPVTAAQEASSDQEKPAEELTESEAVKQALDERWSWGDETDPTSQQPTSQEGANEPSGDSAQFEDAATAQSDPAETRDTQNATVESAGRDAPSEQTSEPTTAADVVAEAETNRESRYNADEGDVPPEARDAGSQSDTQPNAHEPASEPDTEADDADSTGSAYDDPLAPSSDSTSLEPTEVEDLPDEGDDTEKPTSK